MAGDKIIMTKTMSLCDVDGNYYDYRVRVYYDRKADEFYSIVPFHLGEDTTRSISQSKIGNEPVTVTPQETSRIYAERAQIIIEKLESNIYRYRHSLKKKKKVIAYQIKYDKDLPFENGVGFLVDYKTCWELILGNRKDYLIEEPCDDIRVIQCTQRSVDVCLRGHFEVMDWSEKRESFFRELIVTMEKLKEKCHDFLDDKKLLIANIDSGFKLLK